MPNIPLIINKFRFNVFFKNGCKEFINFNKSFDKNQLWQKSVASGGVQVLRLTTLDG